MASPTTLGWHSARNEALRRTGNRCVVCHYDGPVTVHHKIPRSEGGTNHQENLIVLCPTHHGEAHRHPEMFSESESRGEASRVGAWLTRDQVCTRFSISRATSYRYEREGYIPKAAKLGPGVVRWSVEEVERFERRLLADRGNTTPLRTAAGRTA